jgi:uncharacterized protein YoxC
MDATPLKIDGMNALIKQLADDVKASSAVVESNTTAMGIMSNSMESMAEAFRELTEKITAEPDEADSLGEMLQRINHTVNLIYARMPAPARK